jgi:hypothetical protein
MSVVQVVVGVSERVHNSWFKKLCRAPLEFFQASSAMMCVLNLFSLNVQDSKCKQAAVVSNKGQYESNASYFFLLSVALE